MYQIRGTYCPQQEFWVCWEKTALKTPLDGGLFKPHRAVLASGGNAVGGYLVVGDGR